MNSRKKRKFMIALGLLAAFGLWTAALRQIDVQAIGPQGSTVGFAALNQFIHTLTGVHLFLYVITDWLSLIPLGFALGFGLLGLSQWICRKDLRKVDRNILTLGGFYLVVMAAFLLFERYPVNYRPILIEGVLEASYPSSTTLLVLTIMPTTALQLGSRIKHPAFRRIVLRAILLFTVAMLIGRLISGVHWFTDIVGAVLLSAGLVIMYTCFMESYS